MIVWIPMNERDLPKDERQVLVTFEYPDGTRDWKSTFYSTALKRFSGLGGAIKVIAWADVAMYEGK